MIIWKWPLFQTILDGFTIREILVSYDEIHVPTIDDEGQIDVRKKQYTFQKKKQKNVNHNVQSQGSKVFI